MKYAIVIILAILILLILFYNSKPRIIEENTVEPFKEMMGLLGSTISDQKPYISDPINSVDDYEYNVVFKNEGSRALSKDLRNKLASQYPMDWSMLPPNSSAFQESLTRANATEGFEDGSQNNEGPSMDTPYKELHKGYDPPDEDATDAAEKKILASYVPKRSQDKPGVYDIEDAKELIQNIYKEKGLIPEIVSKPNNVYEVVGTQEINPKIVWEDQAPVQYNGSAAIENAGEQTIEVPYGVNDADRALDPYFNAKPGTRERRWDYRQWTPGLERMFGPTQPQAAWY